MLGKAGVQSKYFQAERGSGIARKKCSCYLDLKHFLKILLRGWGEKKEVLIKLKGLPHF